MELLFNILIGILGIVFYVGWNSREYLKNNSFSIKTHFNENWKRWIWAVSMLVLMTFVLWVEPKLSEALKTFTGLDIANERGAYFTTGLALAGLIKGVVKKQN